MEEKIIILLLWFLLSAIVTESGVRENEFEGAQWEVGDSERRFDRKKKFRDCRQKEIKDEGRFTCTEKIRPRVKKGREGKGRVG